MPRSDRPRYTLPRLQLQVVEFLVYGFQLVFSASVCIKSRLDTNAVSNDSRQPHHVDGHASKRPRHPTWECSGFQRFSGGIFCIASSFAYHLCRKILKQLNKVQQTATTVRNGGPHLLEHLMSGAFGCPFPSTRYKTVAHV